MNILGTDVSVINEAPRPYSRGIFCFRISLRGAKSWARRPFIHALTDVVFWRTDKRYFISEIKSDRRFCFRHPVSRKTVWLQQDELVKLIKDYFWDKTKIVRYGNALLPVYSFHTRLKGCSVPLCAFVVFDKLSEDDSKSVHILITGDWRLSYKRIVNTYMLRWGIEKMFRELKDTLYFDHYQVRRKEKIMRYWMLCVLVFSLISWVKLKGCLTKVLNYSPGVLMTSSRLSISLSFSLLTPICQRTLKDLSSILLILSLNGLRIGSFISDF